VKETVIGIGMSEAAMKGNGKKLTAEMEKLSNLKQ